MNDSLNKAIGLCDGQAGLARRLTELTGSKVTQQRIWNIIRRGKNVPAELVIPIERATDGAISRHDLRPDLYPTDEVPASSATEAA